MKRLILSLVIVLSLTSAIGLAQDDTGRAGVAVTVAPVQIDIRDYPHSSTYEPPLWLSRFEVTAGHLPAFALELVPQLHYVEHCVYGYTFHVWRFQGSVAATLSNAATGETLSSETFTGAIPDECPSELRVTQMGDRITWPSDEALIAWLESAIGDRDETSLRSLIDAQIDTLEPVGDLIGAERPPQVVVFSPDSRYLAAGGESFDPHVYLWETASGTLSRTFVLDEHDSTAVGAVTFSADGRMLAAASDAVGNVLRVWDVASGQLMFELRELYFPGGGLTISPDASLLAVSTTGSEVALIDLAAGEVISTLTADYVHTLAFDRQGSYLYSVGRCGEHTCMQTWDVVSGNAVAQVDLGAGFSWAAFTPARDLLVVGRTTERAGRVDVWQVAEGQLYAALPDQDGTIIGLAFDPEGTHLAVFADDGDDSTPQELTIWTLATSENRAFLLPGFGGLVDISPDFTLVAVGRWYSDIVLWRASSPAAGL